MLFGNNVILLGNTAVTVPITEVNRAIVIIDIDYLPTREDDRKFCDSCGSCFKKINPIALSFPLHL